MRVWPRLTMHQRWKGKANQKQYICNQIYVGYYSWIVKWVYIKLRDYMQTKQLRGFKI